jgi:hypothetical protein
MLRPLVIPVLRVFAMKVSSAAPQVSALETWLHETQGATSPEAPAVSASALAANASDATQGRDAAEGLLELNVWSALPAAAARPLTTAAPAPQQPLAPALWSDHIFAPLTTTQS